MIFIGSMGKYDVEYRSAVVNICSAVVNICSAVAIIYGARWGKRDFFEDDVGYIYGNL